LLGSSLLPYSNGFRAVVDQSLFEPRMLQSLLGGYALLGIVHKNLPKQVEKLLVEAGARKDEVLQSMLAYVSTISKDLVVPEAASLP
jgi:hypothetical protein